MSHISISHGLTHHAPLINSTNDFHNPNQPLLSFPYSCFSHNFHYNNFWSIQFRTFHIVNLIDFVDLDNLHATLITILIVRLVFQSHYKSVNNNISLLSNKQLTILFLTHVEHLSKCESGNGKILVKKM